MGMSYLLRHTKGLREANGSSGGQPGINLPSVMCWQVSCNCLGEAGVEDSEQALATAVALRGMERYVIE
jgi:hypothetical protein